MHNRSSAARQADLPFTNDHQRDRADYGNGVIIKTIQDLDQIIAQLAVFGNADTGEATNILQQAREDLQTLHDTTEENLLEYDGATTTGDAPV